MLPASRLVLGAILAAGTLASTSRASPPEPLASCSGDTAWIQLPDGDTAILSQDDACMPFWVEPADDFVGTGELLTAVTWWSDLPEWYTLDEGMRVNVYLTDASGRPSQRVYTGEVPLPEHVSEDTYVTRICGALPEPFPTVPGRRYSLSVRAVHCYPPQIRWRTGTGNGAGGYLRGSIFDDEEWMAMSDLFGDAHELAFVLLSESDATPVDSMTWSTIKAYYRSP